MALKRHTLISVIGIFFIIAFTGCNLHSTETPSEPFERRELPRKLTTQEVQIVDGSGTFGFDLMQKLTEEKPDQSHFISPLSILMAYGMTMNGAEGDTYNQMRKVFGLENMSRKQINQSARDLIELLVQFDEKVQFNIANSIWYRNTYDVEEEFLDTNREYYKAVIEAADFNDPETVDRINNWVDEQTEGLIEKIIKGPIDPSAIMYLINAIYFKGDWTEQFDPEKTQTKTFHSPNGPVDVDMMHMEAEKHMLYKSGEDYQALNLYYGDAGFAMTLVLPDEELGLTNWLSNLNWTKWQELTENFSEVTLTLEMPKFELEYEVEDFKKVLQEMGILDAFNLALSDFSRINKTSGKSLYISETRHKTFIRVNEEGTEAAAATSVVIAESAPIHVEISFNRPFFYVIREVESGTILFMGTMTGVGMSD